MTKKLGLAAMIAAAATMCTSMVYAADMDAMVTKAPMMAPAAVAPTACGSVTDFFLTSCPLSWYGVTFYGTVDVGGGYQTNGTRFDQNSATGASEFLNSKAGHISGWTIDPNGLSQSTVGFKVLEPVGGGWNFVADASLAFDPYSARLANNPLAMQNAIGNTLPTLGQPIDSSRWGWLASPIYAGVSNANYGTLTFGRQTALLTDAVNAYDPMGGSYAFSPIGYSGMTCGTGDTEECRWTTAIKYRVNIGPVRLAVEGQPMTYGAYNPNNGAIQGQIGGDIKGVIPGVVSLDVLGSFVKDAVNIGVAFAGAGATPSGMPIAPFPPAFMKATISNNTSFMAVAKYSLGS